uniref:Plexin-B2-like n=1 Tax=Sinocyclocheilus anshuiensis TaxID=1608454 RepID=A0A671NR48_9TELE
MTWRTLAVLSLLLCFGSSCCDDSFMSDTVINNVIQDPQTGRIYLGAINNIYQLNYDLQKESSAVTGPRHDNPQCTPPITAQCTDAKDMYNINKLLLVNSANGTLIVCGSLFRGICSLVSLNSVDKPVYYSDTKGEKTYVASTEESVTVVGVISYFIDAHTNANLSVFLVGKGYGSSDSSKLISTRLLQEHGEMDVFENMVEASTVQASPFVQRYLHDFRHAFKDNGYIYFLFSRTPGTSDSRKITFIARLCENDHHYYSYTELQLNCSVSTEQRENTYNKVQAAYLAKPGEILVLFAVFSADEDGGRSALCMYPLILEDEKPKTVYSPYISKTEAICRTKRDVRCCGYKCGAEFLPSPLASKPEYALAVKPIFTRNDMLTAVAVAVENEHTVAFLGTSGADVLKVSPIPGSDFEALSSLPVQACEQRHDCHSCVSQRDPYCGWCVLEVPVKITVNDGVEVASSAFEFYNCAAVVKRSENTPCIACVTSKWGCQWNIQDHTCSDRDDTVKVVLYNCSVRREDCSLCKNADQKYNCVWCDTTKSCIYRDLCNQELKQCPPPKITDIVPRYGPMKGQISVTIKGSNLGIKQEDIKRITIAGVPCTHQPERYSVSTRYSMTALLEEWGITAYTLPFKNVGSVGFFKNKLLLLCNKFVQEFCNKSETVLEFLSPAVNKTYINQSLRTIIQLDNLVENLTEFVYHQDPSFDTLTDKAITENSIISVHGKGFSKAMTAKEAQAFVGDVSCAVTILEDDKLFLVAPSSPPKSTSRRHRRDTSSEAMELTVRNGSLQVLIPLILTGFTLCSTRKSQQAEREYEKIKNQLANLEESVRDRCKKEFTDLMIEMEDHTSDLNEARIPFLDYKNYTNRVFFLPSKDGANDVMITGKLDIPESRRAIVDQALNQFSNLLNSKTFLINFIRTLEGRQEFNARNKVYFASLLMVALHGKLEYYTDIMRTLLLELMEEYVHSKNPKLMLRRSETVVERMLCNWMSICLYQFLKDSAGEPLYKLFKAIKHQVEKGPVDAKMKKAKYTLNDTGLLGDDVEYTVLTLQVLVHGEGPDVTPVKVLNCDSISQVKEKIIEQVYRNLPYSQRPTVDSVALEWRPGSTGQILSDLDLTSQKEGRWKRINTLAHYNVRNGATLVLSRVLHTQQSFDQNQDNHEERNALLEDDKVFHLVRPADELDEVKSKRGSMKDKATTKAITEIYLTRLLSMKGTLQQFVDDFFRSVLCSGTVVPPAVKYFFDFLDEQAQKHDNVDDETIHIWKTNSLPLRFWVNILKNPHFIFDVHVTEVVDASLSVIAQTFMDACTKTEHKLTRESPSNKLLYAKEISTYKKMVDDYYKGIRQMVPVSDQDMNTHLAEVSRSHTDKLNTQVALHQLYQYASKYYDGIISSLENDPAAQSKQLTLRLQQIAAALENKVTDL